MKIPEGLEGYDRYCFICVMLAATPVDRKKYYRAQLNGIDLADALYTEDDFEPQPEEGAEV